MLIKKKEIIGLMDTIGVASLIKYKSIKNRKPEEQIKDFVSLSVLEKEKLMKNIYVKFELTASLFFIKNLLKYEIVGFNDITEILLKKKKFVVNKNNEFILDHLFNVWLNLYEGLSKFKNKEKRWSTILGKEVTYDETYEYVLMNMPTGIKFDVVFSINYYELKKFYNDEKNNELSEIKGFINVIENLTLFKQLI